MDRRLGALLTCAVLLAGCTATPAGDAVAVPRTTSSEHSASSRRYETDRGVFYVELPSNYISVKERSPPYLQVFQQGTPNMRIVDVFMTADDYRHSGEAGRMMDGQLVQLQIFPPDEPQLSDADWERLRDMLPEAMTGGKLRKFIDDSTQRALERAQRTPTLTPIADMRVGEVTVIQRDSDSIRWATVSQLATTAGEKADLIQVSAARRIGPYVYLVQTVLRKRHPGDELKAIASANAWVERITAEQR